MTGPTAVRCLRNRRAGFTLFELMIVVTIILILVAIAIPNLLASRLQANETATVSVLRNLATSQAQFQRGARADEDGDQSGEYGTFGELTGAVPIRGTTITASQISRSMANVDANGEVTRNGYVYRMYLPAPGGAGQREQANGGLATGLLDPDLAEVIWVCYAYPSSFQSSGSRTFFFSSHTSMLFAAAPAYTASNCAALHAGAALLGAGTDDVSGRPAIGQLGTDGNFWKQVQ